MSELTSADIDDLQYAAEQLETRSLAITIAEKAGMPIEALLNMLPKTAHAPIGLAVNKALEQCLRIAVNMGKPKHPLLRSPRAHLGAVAITGAVGGFFGLPGVIAELPVTTTLMLHSIVQIAREQGEDLSREENALACLQVLALGPHGGRTNMLESAYYASRTALMQVTREASAYIAREGLAKEGAPALATFLGRIGSRFGVEASEKVAAEMVPIAGAIGGMAINVIFINYFQRLAEGHFIVRRLERRYGSDTVRLEYQKLQRQLV